MSKPVGHVRGTLLLQVGDTAPVELGEVHLPIFTTRVSTNTGTLAVGLGVNLEEVAQTVQALFRRPGQAEAEGADNG